MRIFLVRHGQTHQNVAGIIQGQGCGTLNENGKSQAKRVAERLKDEKFSHIYVSDLERTRETAKEILPCHPDSKTEYVIELREKAFGEFEGKPGALIRAERAKSEAAGVPFGHHRPPGGENLPEVQERILGFWKKLVDNELHETVLLVGHGGIFTMLLMALEESELSRENYDRYHPKNTAVTIIDIDQGKHKIHVLNCTKHLE